MFFNKSTLKSVMVLMVIILVFFNADAIASTSGNGLDINGTWDVNANGYQGKLNIHQNGDSFEGSILNDPIINGVIYANNTISFTRPSSNQNYTGICFPDNNGKLVIKGVFSSGGRIYEWTATGLVSVPVNTGGEREIFNNGNIYGVRNGPSNPTRFTINQPFMVTFLSDYHYFNHGVLPGTIALRHQDGTMYGPWRTTGRPGQGNVPNAYWDGYPNEVLKPGTYTLVDSDPGTWSCNAQSGNCGFTAIKGYPADLPGGASQANSDLDGIWDMNANGYTGKLEIHPMGSTFNGLFFGEPITHGMIRSNNTITFTRPNGNQDYQGALSTDGNGNLVLKGTFTWEGGTYNWIATKPKPVTETTIVPVSSPHPGEESGANVALGKKVEQSSTDYDGLAKYAVDGNTDGNFWNKSCSHTGYNPQAWWQADLDGAYSIQNVVIWNRTDGNQDRLSKFYVLVSDTPFSSPSLDVVLKQPGVSSYYIEKVDKSVNVSINRVGRYVRIQLIGTNYLHMAEVQVFSQGQANGTNNPVNNTNSSNNGDLTLDKTTYNPGEEIKVSFRASTAWPGNAWIGIIPSVTPHGSEPVNDQYDIAYQYINGRPEGVMVFKAPNPGQWDLRMNDTDSGGKEVAYISFTVGTSPSNNNFNSNTGLSNSNTGIAKDSYRQVDLGQNGQLPGGGLRGGRSIQDSKVPIGGNVTDGGKFYIPWFSSNTGHNHKASFNTNGFQANCIYILANCSWWDWGNDVMVGKPVLKITVHGSQTKEFYIVSGLNIWEWNASAPNLAVNTKKVSIVDQYDSNSYLTRFDFPSMNVTGVDVELVATTKADNSKNDGQQIIELHGITLGNE